MFLTIANTTSIFIDSKNPQKLVSNSNQELATPKQNASHYLVTQYLSPQGHFLLNFVMQREPLIEKTQNKNLTQLHFREKLVNVNKSFVIIRAERDERLKLHSHSTIAFVSKLLI
jgi:hypothetical protein